ncbi:alpha/beta fold hydrolase [Microbacterium sp. cf332]|uniref:alpha/beta fold hydrolase n=1 Tax=Microbacterium sp. cf332 TaxID=1761804 RepID=UPI00087FE9EB|nr:alpha/beta fold hydrolase [Microbacterium sp. cf332]SDQ43661.1 Pimeloyl-ACP methyl ester carboxylesterase [Microbacterium sp. cf332]
MVDGDGVSDELEPADIDVDTVEFDGVRTRVTRVQTERSAESGRVFVLIAGIGVAATYFDLLAPTLAQDARVYALDLPGFAGQRAPRDEPSVAFFADQVEAVLDRFGLDDPVLLGHSFGTQIVTEVLVRRPGIRRAVLIGPVVNDRERSTVLQAIRFAQSSFFEPFRLVLLAVSAYLLCGFAYFIRVLPHMMRYPLTDRLAEVSAQVLLIRGARDFSSPRYFHSALVAVARDAWRWEVHGAAHSVINGNAIGVAKLMRAFTAGDLARRGQMSREESRVPQPAYGGIPLILRAMRYRAQEWFSAKQGDEVGVAHAKESHAAVMWRAFTGGRA